MANNIVVGIDGSGVSKRALRWAVDHAAATGGKVTAVTAWTVPSTSGTAGIGTVTPVAPDEAARAVLEQVVDEVLDESDRGLVTARVVNGPAAKVLVDESAGADLLVVGSRGLGGFAGLLLGSVSQQVTEHAACPVTVIRG